MLRFVVFCGVVLVTFFDHLDVMLMTFLATFRVYFWSRFDAARVGAVTRTGGEGLTRHIRGYCVGKSPLRVA